MVTIYLIMRIHGKIHKTNNTLSIFRQKYIGSAIIFVCVEKQDNPALFNRQSLELMPMYTQINQICTRISTNIHHTSLTDLHYILYCTMTQPIDSWTRNYYNRGKYC